MILLHKKNYLNIYLGSFLLFIFFYTFLLPVIKEITNKTINIKNTILAIPAAAPAIPPNPKTPAINAIITNMIVQRNIIIYFKVSI
tara:strand:+ start:440 stop:697 length:258 start_codon:yes stop_codon:yes gene_type:complete